jgi:hypothetical protein
MVCVRLPAAVKFKRRVQVTVWAGAFVRFAAFEVPGVSSAFLGTRALSRLSGLDTFQKSNGLLVCLMRLIVVLMRLIVVLMRLIVVLMRLKYQCMPSDPGTLIASKQPKVLLLVL